MARQAGYPSAWRYPSGDAVVSGRLADMFCQRGCRSRLKNGRGSHRSTVYPGNIPGAPHDNKVHGYIRADWRRRLRSIDPAWNETRTPDEIAMNRERRETGTEKRSREREALTDRDEKGTACGRG